MAINQQATRAHGACTRHLFRIAGEKHDRNVARPRVAFQLAEQIPRARVPKRQFGHDDVLVQLARPSKGFGTVLGGGDVEAHRRERDGKQCERIVVAVYQQHERSHRWCVRATPIHGPDPPKTARLERYSPARLQVCRFSTGRARCGNQREARSFSEASAA
jgi:hypothetical protein